MPKEGNIMKAKVSKSDYRTSVAKADTDNTVRLMYSRTLDGKKVHGVVVLAADAMSYSIVTDHKYRGDSDFFNTYLSSDCPMANVPSHGGPF
jgi:hypothetical protein